MSTESSHIEIRKKNAKIRALERAQDKDLELLAEDMPPVQSDREDLEAEDVEDDDLESEHGAGSDVEYDVAGGPDHHGGDDDDDNDTEATGIVCNSLFLCQRLIRSQNVEDVSLPITPAKRSRAPADTGSDQEAGPRKKAYKVRNEEFTPRTRRFGILAKKELRRVTATVNPYPGTLNRSSHIKAVIKSTAIDSRTANNETRGVYERLERDPELMGRFITFVSFLLEFVLYRS